MDDLLQAEIEARRDQLEAAPSSAGDDVLSLMLLARDESGQSMTDRELKDELITMLAAGHETTFILQNNRVIYLTERGSGLPTF